MPPSIAHCAVVAAVSQTFKYRAEMFWTNNFLHSRRGPERCLRTICFSLSNCSVINNIVKIATETYAFTFPFVGVEVTFLKMFPPVNLSPLFTRKLPSGCQGTTVDFKQPRNPEALKGISKVVCVWAVGWKERPGNRRVMISALLEAHRVFCGDPAVHRTSVC